MSSSDVLVKNPHSILLALKNRPKEVLDITFPKDRSEGVWKEIEALVERHKIRRGSGQTEKPAQRTQDSRRTRGPGNDREVNSGRESGHGALLKQK